MFASAVVGLQHSFKDSIAIIKKGNGRYSFDINSEYNRFYFRLLMPFGLSDLEK